MYTHAELNIDRLLRDVESRLAAMEGAAGRDEGLRLEVMDALREAIARERRGLDPFLHSGEGARAPPERRAAARRPRGHPRLRAPGRGARRGAEAARPGGARGLLLVAVAEPGTGLRVAAVGGGEAARLVGALLADSRLDAAGESAGRCACATPRPRGRWRSPARRPCARGWRFPSSSRGTSWGCWSPAAWPSTPSPTRSCCGPRRWPSGRRRRCASVQLQDQVRRYATLLEQVVEVDQRVFRGRGPRRARPRDPRGGVPHRGLPRGVARPADAAGAGGGRELGRRLGRGRRARRRPRTWPRRRRAACPPPGMLDVAESLGHGAARRAGLPRARSRRPRAHVGCLAAARPRTGSPRRTGSWRPTPRARPPPSATPRCTTAGRETAGVAGSAPRDALLPPM